MKNYPPAPFNQEDKNLPPPKPTPPPPASVYALAPATYLKRILIVVCHIHVESMRDSWHQGFGSSGMHECAHGMPAVPVD